MKGSYGKKSPSPSRHPAEVVSSGTSLLSQSPVSKRQLISAFSLSTEVYHSPVYMVGNGSPDSSGRPAL